MARLLLVLCAAAWLALPAAALAQEPNYPTESRPHSTASLRALAGVAVDGLHARVRPAGRRLRVVATFRAHLRSGARRRVVLRVGSCHGANSFPTCPTRRSRVVVVRRAGTRAVLRARVPRPRDGVDAVRVSVTRPRQEHKPFGRPAHAVLDLGGEAWRAPLRDRSFGATAFTVPGVDLRSLTLDAVGISDLAVRPTARFAALAGRAASVTWQGAEGAWPPESVPLTPGREGGEQRRPLVRTQSPTVGMVGAVDGAPLFSVDLPRPLR